jgi:hypothetical protein
VKKCIKEQNKNKNYERNSCMAKEEYDGFYFLPGEEEYDINIAYFKFKEKWDAPAIESSPLGDKYHVAFFKRDINGDPMFDEEFEAIFADPSVYVQGLAGAKLYGCVLRKTEKSTKWWCEYLERAQKTCLRNKLISVASNILESKS